MSVRSFVVPWDNIRSFYRIAFFLPQLTSFVVVALMFALIYDKDYGLFNGFLAWLGIAPVPWLRDERFSMISIVIVAIWAFIGINSFYFLAGLQGIPDEINEAAAIDGANRPQSFSLLRCRCCARPFCLWSFRPLSFRISSLIFRPCSRQAGHRTRH